MPDSQIHYNGAGACCDSYVLFNCLWQRTLWGGADAAGHLYIGSQSSIV